MEPDLYLGMTMISYVYSKPISLCEVCGIKIADDIIAFLEFSITYFS